MTCLTPSHEEKIVEGVSCTLLDTVDALTIETNRDNTQCLLGDSIETGAESVKEKDVKSILEKVDLKFFQDCNLPFLHAQMFKNYKKHIDPSLTGNKSTQKVVEYKRKRQ